METTDLQCACCRYSANTWFLKQERSWDELPDKMAIQLNDTHPTISIPELLRILVDIYNVPWQKAWNLSYRIFSYTNHTVMPEALEKWGIDLLGRLLPRHLEIIYLINHIFMEQINKKYHNHPNRYQLMASMSLVEESNPKMIRMANLCIVSSHAVNGVAAIHTHLLKTQLFKDFDEYFENKIRNKTNGVTPRRWIHCSNPELSALWTKHLGSYAWLTDLDLLRDLLPKIEDSEFREEFHQIKQKNKQRLAAWVKKECGVDLPIDAMFDVQVKRIHEYKRQHLFALYMIYRYIWIKEMHPEARSKVVKRVFMVGGKAAPGYIAAKKIIKLITSIGDVVNKDPDIGDLMKVVFLPNYNVSNAQVIIPGTDLSEQISTAGTEASGTSNMKFVMNGAIIIGTLDGANVEIAEEVGLDNIIIFGAKVDEVDAIRNKREQAGSRLRKCFDYIRNGTIGNPRELSSIVETLENSDFYIVKHDFYLYLEAQERADKLYSHKDQWLHMSISGALKMGKFSSDRTINEYAEDIWSLDRVKIQAPSSSAITRVRSLPNLVPADVKLENRRRSLKQKEASLIFEIPQEFLENSLIDSSKHEEIEE